MIVLIRYFIIVKPSDFRVVGKGSALTCIILHKYLHWKGMLVVSAEVFFIVLMWQHFDDIRLRFYKAFMVQR